MTRPGARSDGSRIEMEDGSQRVVLEGTLGLNDLPTLEAELAALGADAPVLFDLSEAERIDTSVAWVILRAERRIGQAGGRSTLDGANAAVRQILETVREGLPEPEPEPEPERGLAAAVARLGEAVVGLGGTLTEFTGVLGLFVARLAGSVIHPRAF